MKEYKIFNQQLTVLRNRKSDRLIYILYFGDLSLFIANYINLKMRNQIEDMVNDNHKDFVKAIISVEKGANDESVLDKLYDAYMDNDTVNFICKCKEISPRTFRR